MFEFIEFIESPIFERVIYDYLDDEGYGALQAALPQWPEAGDLIPGSGSCRKLRWHLPGKGKRGGLRVIYIREAARWPDLADYHLWQRCKGDHSGASTEGLERGVCSWRR